MGQGKGQAEEEAPPPAGTAKALSERSNESLARIRDSKGKRASRKASEGPGEDKNMQSGHWT